MGNSMSVSEDQTKFSPNEVSLTHTIFRFLKELQPDEKYHLSMALVGIAMNAITNMSYPRILGLLIDSSESGQLELDRQGDYHSVVPFYSFKSLYEGISTMSSSCSFNRIFLHSLPIYVGGSLASWFRIYHTHSAIYLIQKRYRRQMFEKLLSQNLLFFQSNTANYFVQKFQKDCQDGPSVLIETLAHLLRCSNSVVVGTYHLFSISSSLAMSMLLSLPLFGACMKLVSSFIKRFQSLKTQKLDSVIAKAEEVISGIENVISFSKEDHEVESFIQDLNKCDEVAYKSNSLDGLLMGSILSTVNLSSLVMIYFGTRMMRSGDMTIGKFASFVLYGGFVGMGLVGLSTVYGKLVKASMSMNSIYSITDLEEKSDEKIILDEVKGSLEVQNVSFKYPSRSDYALKDISMRIEPGEVVAVVGPSGAGKTTLCKLFITIYRPTEGEILVDSTDVSRLSSKWLRDSVFSIVTQEPVLFSTTIEENMKYGNVKATDEEMIEAAKDCNIHEFIDTLPMKYQSEVGTKGVALSTGQKQRICLVRAILKKTPVLILDEPTSSLDGFSEELVTTAIKLTTKDKTVIIITHKPQILNQVSKVAVLNTSLEYFGPLEGAKARSKTFKSLFPSL
ncbi:ABC transporter [Theileria orientalis strain Shintoku]|uniref:ABC transporter n=1 Tax=Theileria orientalis strain Shintoku TaxID=869250 RepID=J7M4L9_THEOR|nr:ABC transporter [Theileria orientalis strain Shintoku]BAM38765.1 ABC transporter [Theileria orientalis strain Shintoku]|eukprot:XP_009689066.1 ABC transporter [Theileria orientalis strain Shintoku]